MADHIWKVKGKKLTFSDEVKIIDKEEQWRLTCLYKAAQTMWYSDLISRHSKKPPICWAMLTSYVDRVEKWTQSRKQNLKRLNQIVFKELLKNYKNNLCHWILRFEFISWCFSDWQAWKTMTSLFEKHVYISRTPGLINSQTLNMIS